MSVPEDDHPESDLKQPGFECQFTDQQDYVTSRVCPDCKEEAWSKLCIHIIHNSFNLGWFFSFLPKKLPKIRCQAILIIEYKIKSKKEKAWRERVNPNTALSLNPDA